MITHVKNSMLCPARKRRWPISVPVGHAREHRPSPLPGALRSRGRSSGLQHPLQMLFIFASTLESSAFISTSPGIEGPGVTVPSIRLPPIPVVDPPTALGDPVALAVPNVLVPGGVGTFWALPAPLGSFAELLRPPALAGPLGTPLTAAVPAPGAPALGVPTALPLPMLGPLAAPVVDVPPPEVPPADPPPLLCASASVPVSDKAVAVANAITVVLMWYPSLREGTTTRDNLSFQKNCSEQRSGTLPAGMKNGAERVRCGRIGL
jgi:hypothetical protein